MEEVDVEHVISTVGMPLVEVLLRILADSAQR